MRASLEAIKDVRGAGLRMAFAFDTKSKPGSIIVHSVQLHTMELPNDAQFSNTNFTMLHGDNDLRLIALAEALSPADEPAPVKMPGAESMVIVLDDGTGKAFDTLVHKSGAAPDLGDLRIVTKNKGTVQGNPIACIAFTAVINGQPQLVQTVTTVKCLKATLAALNGRYP